MNFVINGILNANKKKISCKYEENVEDIFKDKFQNYVFFVVNGRIV